MVIYNIKPKSPSPPPPGMSPMERFWAIHSFCVEATVKHVSSLRHDTLRSCEGSLSTSLKLSGHLCRGWKQIDRPHYLHAGE